MQSINSLGETLMALMLTSPFFKRINRLVLLDIQEAQTIAATKINDAFMKMNGPALVMDGVASANFLNSMSPPPTIKSRQNEMIIMIMII